jgi:tight adherence protein C
MVLLAALVLAATVFVAMLAFVGGESQIRTRLDSLRGAPDSRDRKPEQHLTLSQRMFQPVTAAIVELGRKIFPTRMLAGVEQRLILAGEPMTVNTFITFQVMSAGGFLFLPLVLVFAMGIGFGLGALGFIVIFAAIGLFLPHMWLSQRIGQRQSVIIKSLPDAFDLITTCVEAGLGLDAALARVAEKVEGPFADELSRTLREISLGRMRSDALKELGDRTGVPDLVTFVNAVIQAERMGSSVGAVLRVQSEQLRVRRRQRAEEQAYKAPVKMIFPLVLCIFPTLFIVILGPAVITIMRDFPAAK